MLMEALNIYEMLVRTVVLLTHIASNPLINILSTPLKKKTKNSYFFCSHVKLAVSSFYRLGIMS